MTSQWMQYAICRVRYNSTRSHIDQVEVRTYQSGNLSEAFILLREQVVFQMNQGKTFCTTTQNLGNSMWYPGPEVHKIVVNGQVFLRTDSNEKLGDNLGNLPEF